MAQLTIPGSSELQFDIELSICFDVMSDQPWTIEKALEGARYLRSQLQDGKPTYIHN